MLRPILLLCCAALCAEAPLPAPARARFLARPFVKDYGNTTARVMAVLGRPLERKAREEPNRHRPERRDSIVTLIYPGLEFSVYKSNPPDGRAREIHLSTAVSNARYEVRYGLNVGTPVAAVKRLLGPPTSEEPGSLFYEAGEFQGVAFHHAKGAITRVEKLTFPD